MNNNAKLEMDLIHLRIEEIDKEMELLKARRSFLKGRLERLESQYKQDDIIEVL